MRTIPDVSVELQALENSIRNSLIPALLNGYMCNNEESKLFSMPAKFGGLGIFIPMERCDIEYNNSRKITADMVETVYHQNLIYDPAINEKQKVIMNKLKMEKRTRIQNLLNNNKSKIENPIR